MTAEESAMISIKPNSHDALHRDSDHFLVVRQLLWSINQNKLETRNKAHGNDFGRT